MGITREIGILFQGRNCQYMVSELTEEEINIICGVYKDRSGKVTVVIFLSSILVLIRLAPIRGGQSSGAPFMVADAFGVIVAHDVLLGNCRSETIKLRRSSGGAGLLDGPPCPI